MVVLLVTRQVFNLKYLNTKEHIVYTVMQTNEFKKEKSTNFIKSDVKSQLFIMQ